MGISVFLFKIFNS